MSAADTVANTSFVELTTGADFTIPDVDLTGAEFQVPEDTGPLYDTVDRLTNADLTTGTVDGTGAFDVLMKAHRAHLEVEFKANRISGAEYTKAYTALTEGAMSSAVQYLLAKDSSYWQAIGAQMQARTAEIQLVQARVALEISKTQLRQAQMDAQLSKATYALTKLKLATETVAYDSAQYNLTNLLPQQLTIGAMDLATKTVARDTGLYTLSTMLPAQLTLIKEQSEAQRAQTLDVRADGAPVVGSVGKQKDLYNQQITSYQRDAEVKAAKIFTDAWITQKSMDEGTLPPTGFANASLDTILTALKTNNNLD